MNATVQSIAEASPEILWQKFSTTGIIAAEFFTYYATRQIGYAIKLSKIT